jgi:hypothetical protein
MLHTIYFADVLGKLEFTGLVDVASKVKVKGKVVSVLN